MKKYLFLSFLIIFVFGAFSVLAINEKNTVKKLEQSLEKLEKFELPDVESTKIYPSSLYFGPQGQVRIINGELTELANTTPAIDGVKIWGINLKVDMRNASFIPAGNSASNLKVGDRLNIKGNINQDTGIITASLVHSLSARQKNIEEVRNQIRNLIERIRALQIQLGLPLTPLPD